MNKVHSTNSCKTIFNNGFTGCVDVCVIEPVFWRLHFLHLNSIHQFSYSCEFKRKTRQEKHDGTLPLTYKQST